MFKNLLTITIRHIKKQKFFAILNILGLSIGFATCLMIWIYSMDEMSFDTFHQKADRIYRINQTFIWGDDDALFGSTGPAVMHAINSEVPEFEALTRVHTPGNYLVTAESQNRLVVFEQDDILAVDPNFLEVFTFPLLFGNPESALTNPNSVVITTAMAEKYFGTDQVLGRQLQLGEVGQQKSYVITGVTDAVPSNSHIQYDMLLSMSSFPRVKRQSDSWMWTTFVTFGVLRPDADPAVVANKVAAVPGKYLESFLQKYRGISYEEFKESGEKWDLYIQPLLDIHLKSTNVYSRLNETGSIQTIYILFLSGILILALSIINFVNLSTARSSTRAREVGIRKVIGSGRKLLIFQFLTESIFFVAVSALLAIFMVQQALPVINQITDKALNISLLISPLTIAVLFIITLVVGVVSGLYPAFYLSSFQPIKTLKGKIAHGMKNSQVRNTLVTAQFAISIAMIACTLVVKDQVNHWKNIDLGFDKDNKIVIENTERLSLSVEAFKNELLQLPEVDAVTASSDIPPIVFDFDNFSMAGAEEQQLAVNFLMADEHFIDIYDLDVIAGRGLSRDFHDSSNVVVNEHLVKSFGLGSAESALNEELIYGNNKFRIVGVIEDFNTSMSSQSYPFAIFDHKAAVYHDPTTELTINLKTNLNAGQTSALLAEIEDLWHQQSAKAPFEYSFVAQDYLELFRSTIRFSVLLRGIAGLAIIIACLGLIGLVAFIVEQRNKEIGIRKVLGATASNIWLILSGSFGKLMLIGFGIAAPVSWYLMSRWLENFELRTTVSLATIAGAGLIMLLISIVTTSFQTIGAAQIQPVKYLKDE